MLSIIIPTSDRALDLREALRSIQRQTTREAISQVIVSEHSANASSQQICAEFADLPILYRQQDPSVSQLTYWQAIWSLVQSPFVGFLRDQDWWTAHQVQSTLEVLESNSDYPAVYSNYYEIDGPQFPLRSARNAWQVWVSSGRNFSRPLVPLDEIGIMLTSLLGTSLRHSTLIGRCDAIRRAHLKVVAIAEVHDDERLLPLFLSSNGPLAYLTAPGVFVHASSEEVSLPDGAHSDYYEAKSHTTKWLAKTDPPKVALAAARFNEAVSNLPKSFPPHPAFPCFWTAIGDIAGEQWKTLAEECGFDLNPHQPPPARGLKWLLTQLCPPGLLALRRRSQDVHAYAAERTS